MGLSQNPPPGAAALAGFARRGLWEPHCVWSGAGQGTLGCAAPGLAASFGGGSGEHLLFSLH